MPIKIDYKKCCWHAGKCDISGAPKTKEVFERDGKCSSCKCGGKCVGCVEACPVEALSRKKKLELNKDLCIECGACVVACKHGAISLE